MPLVISISWTMVSLPSFLYKDRTGHIFTRIHELSLTVMIMRTCGYEVIQLIAMHIPLLTVVFVYEYFARVKVAEVDLRSAVVTMANY